MSTTLSEPELRYQQVKKVTLIGVVTNVFLSFTKIVVGFIGQSQALIADGVHSLADLISDVIVLFAAKKASEKADDEHPYGHGRFETIAEVALGFFLVAVIGNCPIIIIVVVPDFSIIPISQIRIIYSLFLLKIPY